MKKGILIIILLIILGLSIFILRPYLTGKVIETEDLTEYTHTKAICNESNFCQDYEITCKGNTLIKTQPLTGAVIQHEENWKDPRQTPENLCE